MRSGRIARSLTSLAVLGGLITAAVLVLIAAGQAQGEPQEGFLTDIKPYLKGVPGSGYETQPLLSAGDLVPMTGNTDEDYQMVGIPDGLGATLEGNRTEPGRGDDERGRDDGITRLFMNHELTQTTQSHPLVDTPVHQRGAFVSEYLMAQDGSILSGRRAFDTVYQDDTLVGPAADTTNTTRAFSRFCSGFLGDSRVGFDRPIYLTGEETSRSTGASSTESFSQNGSQTVAIFTDDDGKREAHALSDFGYFAKENTVVAPNTGMRTVAFSLEDGPTTPDSQLYMYVGKKKTGTVLERNGLVGGTLYVFASDDPAKNSEATFKNGTVQGHWVALPKAHDEIEQETLADAAGAFGFVRIEDGGFGRSNKLFNFNTTGESADPTINRLGRNYRLSFDPNQAPAKQEPSLSVVYNGDQVDAAGQDTAFSPDNLTVAGRMEAIQEDGTSASRPEMEERNRDGSVWLVDRTFTSDSPEEFPPRERVAELVGRSEGGRDGIRTGAGIWESSGIIDASESFGKGTYLLDVQAHPPTNPPCPGGTTWGPQCKTETVEDGQLLFLRRAGG